MEQNMDLDHEMRENENFDVFQESTKPFTDAEETLFVPDVMPGKDYQQDSLPTHLSESFMSIDGPEAINLSQPGTIVSPSDHTSQDQSSHDTTSEATLPPLLDQSEPLADQMPEEAQTAETSGTPLSQLQRPESAQLSPQIKVELTEEEEKNIQELFSDTTQTPAGPAVHKTKSSMTKVAKNVMLLAEGMNEPLKLEKADQPEGFTKVMKLYEYQKIGLHWMRSREQGVQGGGILADAMGMGKTVSIIALILACPLPGKDETRKRMSYAPDPTRGPINNGVTLIVAPASLLRQWQKEIESKTEPKLNVLRYESAGKLRYPAWHLNLFHVILVSYETLLSDYNTEEKKIPPVFFNPGYKFHRVVLDEGHRIKNRKSKVSVACCDLEAVNKWYVSGTPIQNSIEELYPALKFLNVPIYSDWEEFNKQVLCMGPIENSIRTIHHILHDYLLRRRKEDFIDGKIIVKLPKKHDIEVIHATFSSEQMDFYNAFESDAQLNYIKYLKMSNHSIDFRTSILLRLRQTCLHPWLVGFSKGDDLHKDLLNEQQLVINACFQFKTPQIQRILGILKAAEANGERFNCENCHEKEVARIIPGCGHGVCPGCIMDIVEDSMINLDEIEPGCCWVCESMYEPLHITTLIGFQCAWREGFRQDDWDAVEAEQEEFKENEEERKRAVFAAFKSQLEEKDGSIVTHKRMNIDPDYWGIRNVESVEKYWEDADDGCNLSFVDDDDDDAREEEEFQAYMEGSDDGEATEPDGYEDDNFGSGNIERPPKRSPSADDSDEASTRKKARYDSTDTELNLDDDVDSTQVMSLTDGEDLTQASHCDTSQAVDSAMDIETDQIGTEFIESEHSTATESGSSVPMELSDAPLIQIDSQENSMDSIVQGPMDPDETALIPVPEKLRMQLKVKFNPKTGLQEFRLPYNLLRLQRAARSIPSNRRRYNQRLIDEGLPDCTKITTLLQYLEKIQTEFPNDRIIIFSEWVTMLDFIDAVLWTKGKQDYLRYDGGLSDERKAAIITEFQHPYSKSRILLCSTKAGNCGLNLTAANRVILFEPHYNPYVEDQAIDRCHRIGQKKEVFVTRIIVPGTIEEKILDIHKIKRLHIDGAIDKKCFKPGREGNVPEEEFKYLIGLAKLA